MKMPPLSKDDQLKHVWNQDDKSYNLFIRYKDKFTVQRNHIRQSTDCIRGKVGYEKGMHLFEITWPTKQRGTHAAVGVGTGNQKCILKSLQSKTQVTYIPILYYFTFLS